MGFAEIQGNDQVKRVLQLALRKKRWPPSILLIDSSQGEAKKLALVLAQAVNCLNLDDDGCDQCYNCQAIKEERFPDVLMVEPVNEVIRVEKIREVKKLAYLRPMVGKRRVFIIDQSEKMNEQAANTLLKVLEEPPSTTIFILLTSNPYLLLPTIRSRCQELQLSPVTQETLEKYIEGLGRDKKEARLMAFFAKGNREVVDKLNYQELRAQRKALWSIVEAGARGGIPAQKIKDYGQYTKRQRQLWSQELAILASFWRDLLLVKLNASPELIINYDFLPELKEMAHLVSLEKIKNSLSWINEAAEEVKKNLNIQVIINSYLTHYQGKKNGKDNLCSD